MNVRAVNPSRSVLMTRSTRRGTTAIEPGYNHPALLTNEGSPRIWVVAVGGLFLFLIAALIKSYVAAHPPRINPVGDLPVYSTFRLTLARLVPWIAWIPLAIVIWRMVPVIDARARPASVTLGVHALCSGVFAGLQLVLTVATNMLILEPAPSLGMFLRRLHGLFSLIYDWQVLTYWAILAAAYAHLFALRSRERELQAAELRSQLNAERLHSLLQQLNPHFLFNSLNAITGLIYNGQRENAAAMISRLGDLLRMTLTNELPQEIALRDEVELLRTYLAIEHVRFGDRLTTSLDVPEGLQMATVPSLLLQPLVENAIRHGVGRVPGRGEVRITARQVGTSLVISVWNSAAGLTRAHDETRNGVGIPNTRERLSRLYGEVARLTLSHELDGSLVTISLPLALNARSRGDAPCAGRR